ncbi:UNVERIFIED_CONTAM: Apoptosis-inducing factorA [Sesamum latifolium]|uniref:Apoptosis-inducing factorA n=1 Tax=Sesamum latifolium TaxID=2727402 RepID=A0AAW2Y2R0_9LAMI
MEADQQSPAPEMAGGVWKRVVVVGGGVAGSLIAKSLQFQADVTLIDPKEYFEIPWASLRAKVEPSFAERSVIYHKDYLTNGRLVVSKAISISNSQVLTTEGRLVTYDYLVIATGHDDPLPKTKSERLKEYQTVHEGSRLLEFIGPKAADKTLEWLKSKRVEVKLRQSVDLNNSSEGNNTYITSSGEIIKADCLFVCTGRPPASAWLHETILKNSVDGLGRLKVDENLRVKGFKNIFAIGDITDVREIKQGYLAQKHAVIAAKNLKVMMRGGKEKKMASYKPHSIKVVVSLGRQDAVAQFPLTTLIGLVPGFIKSKDLFVGKIRKQLGLDPRLVDY